MHKTTIYRSIVGALQYLTPTRPDMSFAVKGVLVLALTNYDALGCGQEDTQVYQGNLTAWIENWEVQINVVECIFEC